MLGEQIKTFRRKKGLTQEELGKRIGVTTQAVSNWERGGVPDAELLPDIADALGVTTDMLFGRSSLKKLEDEISDELLSVGTDEGFKRAFSLLYSIGVGLSGLSPIRDSFNFDALSALGNDDGYGYYSRASVNEGTFDIRLNSDFRYFFLMPEPEKGCINSLGDAGELAKTFSVLGDKDVLKIIYYMYSRLNTPVSLAMIANNTKMDIKKTEELMDKLCERHLASCAVVETEMGDVKAYCYINESIVMPLLCFSRELTDTKAVNMGTMFRRNKPLF